MRAAAFVLSLALVASGASAQPGPPSPQSPAPGPPSPGSSPSPPSPAPEPDGELRAEGAVEVEPAEEPASRGVRGDQKMPPEPAREPSAPLSEPLVEPLEDAPWREEREDGPRYPGYVVAGAITLAAGVGLGVGTVVAVSQGDDRGGLGMGALATIGLGTGIPLLLLGATPEYPHDSEVAYAGIALATSGVIGFGLGGTLWAARAGEANRLADKRDKAEAAGEPTEPFADPEHDYVAPVILMGAGGVALVAGVVTWAIGAASDDHDGAEEPSSEAELVVSPTSIGVRGTF